MPGVESTFLSEHQFYGNQPDAPLTNSRTARQASHRNVPGGAVFIYTDRHGQRRGDRTLANQLLVGGEIELLLSIGGKG